MPFGATVLGKKGTQFRLWAPSAKKVELLLAGQAIEMTPLADGFYECTTPLAQAETLYQYRINSGLVVPDPASRFQPQDVKGPSCVIDPTAFLWHDGDWKGYPWEEAVIYELHVGSFTLEGTFKAIKDKLEHLIALGVTAIQLMPIADFPGQRNWGYDGVLPYAPDSQYGHPDELKDLIQTAHARGLMVFLDVVYSHFGPEGNYLHAYAESFFTERHCTPWGAAINFDSDGRDVVRKFFIHNALYWLEEFHFDGLRLDAVHAIQDDSKPDILEELAFAVHNKFGHDRHIHLILENFKNQATYLVRNRKGKPVYYTAQWNDDIHHALHVLTTGQTDGYYSDYADKPAFHLGRCLTEGFDFQGQPFLFDEGKPRGEPSKHIPMAGFVSFLQNHDQVGNNAFGDRISTVARPAKIKMAAAIYLLSPQIPMLFMGEEWSAEQPFPFFCDFDGELAKAVTEGRQKEFNHSEIPDPCTESTFKKAILDWNQVDNKILKFYRDLIALRHNEIIPLLCCNKLTISADALCLSDQALVVNWYFEEGIRLTLLANFADTPIACPSINGEVLFQTQSIQDCLPAETVVWLKNRDKK